MHQVIFNVAFNIFDKQIPLFISKLYIFQFCDNLVEENLKPERDW